MRVRSIVLGLALAMMAGGGGVPKRSDFLGDMSTFKKVPIGRDAVYYVRPGLTLTEVPSYKELIIESVSVI